MSVDANQFKNGLKLWASGVTVVTTKSEQGPKGMTATSFTSVSMEPPQILVCLNQNTDTGAVVQEQKLFVVNILTAEQQSISNQFAGGASQEQRFAEVAWEHGLNGMPVFSEALVSLECKLVNLISAGSHWIVVGEVQNVICRTGEPLLYFNGAYRELKLD